MSDILSTTLWAGTTGDIREIGVDCTWTTSQSATFHSSGCTPLQTIDIFFSARSDLPRPPEISTLRQHEVLLQTEQHEAQVLTAEELGPRDAFEFLKECLHTATETLSPVVARFLVPLQSGTVIRSDIIPFRLRDAFWVEKAASFASSLQVFSGSLLLLDAVSLAEIIRASAGAILLKPSAIQSQLKYGAGFLTIPTEVESDFRSKLSIPWISTESVTRKRLILIGSSNQGPEGGGWTQFARHAAEALGIDLVIIDREDGWLAQGDYASWYEALLHPSPSWWEEPTPDEIVKLVEGYRANNRDKKIDGLATFIEALQVPVTVAASRLGYSHEQASAFETATNKYKLGRFQNRPAFLVSGAEEVVSLVKSPENQLVFPLIVKPCFGLNSEGVSRVDKASELEEAVEAARISGRGKDEVGDKVLVERYCEGPEVDVNMVFIDGEVLFDEICDDFPKGADVNNMGTNVSAAAATKATTRPALDHRRSFQETNMVFPSALPDEELTVLRNAVKDTITGLGFRNGVMHVEARVAQSKCAYQSAGGIVDLRPRKGDTSTPLCTAKEMDTDNLTPTPWIIEVNPRPPGLFASQTPGSVYGIDYWAISLLLAVGDKERAAALSRPFANGAQSHTVLVMIRADFDPSCEGIFDSDDVCEELLARHPELKEHISRYGCLLKRGQKILHPKEGRNTFVAYMNVFSRTSRQEALDVAKKVREEVRYEIR
ncbi:glutathione synthetase ATP-binding domain-like protein [Xylariaceae sp. AK1471]|nr:glutathione synthetase ATP-binding domain-like protein [Xylariaceae sp. AK1471]